MVRLGIKAKSKIMAAGVVMNLLTALFLFTIVALLGMPKLIDNQFTVAKDTQLVKNAVDVGSIEPGSPAAKAGLKSQDELLSFQVPGYSPVGVESADKLPEVTKNFAGKTVKLYYSRNGVEQSVQVKLRDKKEVDASLKTNNPTGYLGIIPSLQVIQRSTWSAPIVAVGLSVQLTKLTFQGLGAFYSRIRWINRWRGYWQHSGQTTWSNSGYIANFRTTRHLLYS